MRGLKKTKNSILNYKITIGCIILMSTQLCGKIFVDKISFQCLNHICHFRNQKLGFSVVLYHLEGLTGPFTAVTYFICEKVQLICSRNVQKDNIATPLTDFTETV